MYFTFICDEKVPRINFEIGFKYVRLCINIFSMVAVSIQVAIYSNSWKTKTFKMNTLINIYLQSFAKIILYPGK